MNLRRKRIREGQCVSAYVFKVILKCEKKLVQPNPRN